MKKVLVSLGLFLVGALLMFNWPRGEDESEQGLRPTKSRSALLERDVAVNQGEKGERFDSLDPQFHALVLQLEEAYGLWKKKFGPFHNGQIERFEWEEFARVRISELSVEEIVGLLTWIGESGSNLNGLILTYRQALFWNWGKLDAIYALHFLRDSFDRENELEEEGDSKFTTSFSRYTGFWSKMVFEGWAASDGEAAWGFYCKVCENPMGSWPSNWGATEGILQEFTARNAERAWNLIVSESRSDIQRKMLNGYVAGLPENQDWAQIWVRSGEVDEKKSFQDAVVQRWFLEDPDEALKWFQGNVVFQAYWNDPFAEPSEPSNREVALERGLTESQMWEEIKGVSLRKIAEENGRRGQEVFVSWAEENLPNEGEKGEVLIRDLIFEKVSDGPFASDSLFDENKGQIWENGSEWQLSAQGIDFLPLVTFLSPEVVGRQFMLVLNSLPEIREDSDPFEGDYWTLESSKMVREVVRGLVEEVPLSAEERVQAEAIFARLDEQERVLLEGWKREREDLE